MSTSTKRDHFTEIDTTMLAAVGGGASASSSTTALASITSSLQSLG